MVTADLPHVSMFYSCEKSISRKNPVLPIEKFVSCTLPRNAIMLQHLILQFTLYYLLSVHLQDLRENFKLSALKEVAVANERLSLTRGIKHSDLTWKLLLVWKTGRWGEVTSYQRWLLTGGSKHSNLTWKLLYFGKLVTEKGDCNQRFDCIIHILQVANEKVFCSCNSVSRHIWPGPSSQASSGTHLSHNTSHSKNNHWFKFPPRTTHS